MSAQDSGTTVRKEEDKQALNKRLETIGWGLFLIMLGGVALVPKSMVREGVWSIGVGLIMLGLNAARYLNGIKMSGFTLFLGALALFTGIGDLLGVELPVFEILIILVGLNIIIKPLLEKRKG